MSRLDDYLNPLYQGLWEVVVKKELVTEPLDDGWVSSPVNVPSPGTIGSYRKGQYHVHETVNEWRVHLDRYDPKLHPVLHLIDDAPLLLMISDTVITLLTEVTGSQSIIIQNRLQEQKETWKQQIASGIVISFIGIIFLIDPYYTFQNIFQIVLPLALVCLSVFLMHKGIAFRPVRITRVEDIMRGIAALAAGIFIFFLPLLFWVFVLLLVLGLWMFASAVMLLKRVVKGRKSVPEGFFSRLLIGFFSLSLGIMSILFPIGVLATFMLIFGFIVLLIGITMILVGIRLRDRMSVKMVTQNRKNAKTS